MNLVLLINTAKRLETISNINRFLSLLYFIEILMLSISDPQSQTCSEVHGEQKLQQRANRQTTTQ